MACCHETHVLQRHINLFLKQQWALCWCFKHCDSLKGCTRLCSVGLMETETSHGQLRTWKFTVFGQNTSFVLVSLVKTGADLSRKSQGFSCPRSQPNIWSDGLEHWKLVNSDLWRISQEQCIDCNRVHPINGSQHTDYERCRQCRYTAGVEDRKSGLNKAFTLLSAARLTLWWLLSQNSSSSLFKHIAVSRRIIQQGYMHQCW